MALVVSLVGLAFSLAAMLDDDYCFSRMRAIPEDSAVSSEISLVPPGLRCVARSSTEGVIERPASYAPLLWFAAAAVLTAALVASGRKDPAPPSG